MSLSGVVGLLSGRPVHPVGVDGKMALSDHLRELRARILKVALILAIGFGVALIFYNRLFDLVYNPYLDAQRALGGHRTQGVTEGVGAGFLLYFKLSGLASLIGTSPFWLYQIWAFILPALLPREKRWTAIFVAIAGPLFIVGVLIGYLTLPKGVQILISFNHQGVLNLVEFNDYLSFFIHTLLMFGVAFEIPVFVVMLNKAGVLPARVLRATRPWIILGIFVFAAAATPSTDPFTMCMMAIPMCVLYGISEVIARVSDRRKAASRPYADLDPDSPSPLP
ncbi:twin-arginine translocase subunit TatC [Nocardioides sp. BP30]|uniref:twin-arginine translocase subunit TatC n=1 Tax=Nocardioides sp. BP30 TaxID=3036374 RepID=UPI002469A257|nr:twin-arginine translocase subunit TatC [Nocardioides sp. BP30]WGL50764.1 twin-arginine translocase subunit TatC [Nocardioides sp. BP30]